MPQVSLLTNGIGDVKLGGSIMPTGTILAFAGSTAPTGWLQCDGTAYSQTDHADLFSVLGSLYNTQLNPTTGANYTTSAGLFRVPDLRGLFLRGEGQASGQSSVTVGGYQAQTTAKNGLSNSTSSVTAPGSPSGGSISYFSTAGTAGSGAGGSQIGTAAAQTITGDSETRPINRGVKYIIKI